MSETGETIRNCTVCGAALPAERPRGLCPRCLLAVGMESTAERHLHIRCPQCHVPIEIVDEQPIREIICPSCDSRFSLVGEQTATYVPDQPASVGRFELLERVGVGAFGSVWKARDPELDRVVAVKIPRKQELAPDEVEQFVREATAAAQLKHPGIVGVHEVGRDGDRIYIVSDFIDGVTLADRLSAGRLTVREAAELCMRIVGALQHAHQRGVIHRDLKPSNVMLDDDGRPHVMDFGLAKREAAEMTVTLDGRILGTPAYMSPEQARGDAHTADARSDVYSLGVILFELLSGEKPFRGTSRMLLHQVLKDDAPSPRRFNSNIPRDLETICLKCLEKQPDQRFPSAQVLCDELQRFLDGKPIVARPISRLNRGWRWCRRNPVVAALSALVVVSLIAGTSVSTYFAIEEAERASDERDARLLADRREREANEARIAERDARIEMEQQAEVARRAAYGLQLSRAQFHSRHDPALARRLLEDEALCPLELRDFGWKHLHRLASPGIAEVAGTDVLRFSVDNRRVTFVASDRRSIISHDLATGDETTLFTVADDDECVVTFSPQLDCVVTADRRSWDKVRFQKILVLRTRDLESGELLATLDTAESPIDLVEFAPNGELIAVRTRSEIDVRGVRSLDVKLSVTELASVPDLAFSPDSSALATESKRSVDLWDIDTGELRRSITEGFRDFTCIRFSPDGGAIAVGGHPEVTLWNVATGEVQITLRDDVPTDFNSIAFSPDGTTLAAHTTDFPIGLWDLRNGRKWASLTGAHLDVPLTFSPDGRLLASRARKIWRVPQQDDPAIELETGPQPMITLWPDDQTVMTGTESAAQFWDTRTGQERSILELPETYCHAASAEQTYLAVAGLNQIDVYRTADDEKLHMFDCEMAYQLVFSHDETLLAATPINSPFIDLWNVVTGERVARLEAEELCVISLAFSPDGEFLAAGMGFQPAPENPVGRVDVWDVAQRQVVAVLEGYRYGVYAVAFSPDGKSLATASERIKVWDVPNWSERFSVGGHTNIIWGLAYSPDGRSLMSGSFDGTIRLWDPEIGHERLTLGSHGFWVLGLEFSRDGSLLATSSGDGVKLWLGSE